MGIFYAYILKSAICLVSFLLLYRGLLSRETFYRFNRITLMSILFLSFIIPLLEITVTEQTEIGQTVTTVEQLLVATDISAKTTATFVQPIEESFPWMQLVSVVYLAGIFLLICRNLYSYSQIYSLLKTGDREKIDEHTTLIVHEQDIAPFSWMKYMVISRKDLEENGQEILIHERAHIRNGHSWDLLATDICIYLQWFNPAAWLLKQEFQNIHEYEADETVLKEGIDAKQYQLLLIKRTVGTRLYSIANSFDHSKLKKRITMMLKEKSSPWARLKYLYALPLVAFAVVAFSCNSSNEKSSVVKEPVAKVEVEEVASDSISNFNPQAFLVGRMKEKKNPLIIMDGKEVTSAIVMELPIERIKSARLMKPLQVKKEYGDKGKDGVLLMETYSANKIQVNGVVQDEKGKPIVNAIIFLDAAGASRLSDEKGEFTWDAPDNATLSVFVEGYVKQVLKVSPHPVIRLKKK